MDVMEVIRSRRSIRRFAQERLERTLLIELVECARCAPCAGNIQALEYIIVDNADLCQDVFGCLAWAANVRPRRNPAAGQRPVAYIVVLIDSKVKKYGGDIDAAAAIENILIAAWSKGIGSCWLGSIDRKQLAAILDVPTGYKIDSVVALGMCAEKPVMEDCEGEDTRYYLDENDVLHVPKRTLKRITYLNGFGQNIED